MKFSKRLAVAATLPALTLAGCYIVPISPDGRPVWPPLDPAPIHSSTPYAPPVSPAAPSAPAPSQPASAVLQALLYPSIEFATQTGVMNCTAINEMCGLVSFNPNAPPQA